MLDLALGLTTVPGTRSDGVAVQAYSSGLDEMLDIHPTLAAALDGVAG